MFFFLACVYEQAVVGLAFESCCLLFWSEINRFFQNGSKHYPFSEGSNKKVESRKRKDDILRKKCDYEMRVHLDKIPFSINSNTV